MASEQDVAAYVARNNVRVTQGMLGGDPRIGSEEREAYRLHRGDSASYIHSSDVAPFQPLIFYRTRTSTRPRHFEG